MHLNLHIVAEQIRGFQKIYKLVSNTKNNILLTLSCINLFRNNDFHVRYDIKLIVTGHLLYYYLLNVNSKLNQIIIFYTVYRYLHNIIEYNNMSTTVLFISYNTVRK